MEGLEVTVLLGLTILAGTLIAPRVRIALPLVLVVFGLLLGFVPALREVQLPPETVLLLFLPAQQGQLPPQIVVLAVAVELVAEPNRLELGAVHQDAAHAGVGVGLPLVIGAGGHGFPVHKALVQRAGSLVKGIH